MSGLRPLRGTRTLLVDQAYDAIKHAIQSTVLPPGTPLVESRLAAELQISKTPVREALVRLCQDGLAVGAPFKGYYVSTLTRADAESIVTIRGVLEGLAARLAVHRLDTGWDVDELQNLAVRARAEAERGHVDVASEIGHQIHAAIHRACGDQNLQGMIATLHVQFDRVRLMSAKMPGRLPVSLDEHEAVIRAIAARDAELAEARMRAHLESVLEDVRAGFPAESSAESTDKPSLLPRSAEPGQTDES